MAEVENTIVNRAPALLPALGSLLSATAAVAAIIVPLVGGVAWLYHLEGATAANTVAIVELKERTKTIDESRTAELQRLATLEEAVKGITRRLDSIDGKLDRALMDRLGR